MIKLLTFSVSFNAITLISLFSFHSLNFNTIFLAVHSPGLDSSDGSGKVTYLPFGKIQDFISMEEYIEIRKFSGRNPLLLMREPDEFSIILSRLMRIGR